MKRIRKDQTNGAQSVSSFIVTCTGCACGSCSCSTGSSSVYSSRDAAQSSYNRGYDGPYHKQNGITHG